MRAASSRLIEWYYSNYWQPQSEYLKIVTSLCLTSNLSVRKVSAHLVELSSKEGRKVQQQQQLQQQRNGITSDTNIPLESPTFDSLIKGAGSTFITGVFLPIFFCSIFDHNMPENTVMMRKAAKMKKTKKMCDFWWNRILKIQELNSVFFSILSVRLSVAAVDSVMNKVNSSPQKVRKFPGGNLARFEVDWRLHVCRSWVEKLFVHSVNHIINSHKARKSVLDIDISEEVRKNYWNQGSRSSSNVLSAVRSRIELLEDQGGAITIEILSFAEMICNATGLSECVLAVLEEMKRQNGLSDGNDSADGDAATDEGDEGCDAQEEEAVEKEEEEADGRDDGDFESGCSADSDVGVESDREEGPGSDDGVDLGLHNGNHLSAGCNASSGNSSGSSSSSSSYKRQREEAGEEEESDEEEEVVVRSLQPDGFRSRSSSCSFRKITTHRPSGWFTCGDQSVWPLGQIPGHSQTSTHNSCPLYLLREVQARAPTAGESNTVLLT
jgi:hypothetical protein